MGWQNKWESEMVCDLKGPNHWRMSEVSGDGLTTATRRVTPIILLILYLFIAVIIIVIYFSLLMLMHTVWVSVRRDTKGYNNHQDPCHSVIGECTVLFRTSYHLHIPLNPMNPIDYLDIHFLELIIIMPIKSIHFYKRFNTTSIISSLKVYLSFFFFFIEYWLF